MKTALIVMLVGLVCFGTFSLGMNLGFNDWYLKGANDGYMKGQEDTLAQVRQIMQNNNVVFNWTRQSDGSYKIDVMRLEDGKIVWQMNQSLHLLSEQWRPYANLNTEQKTLADETLMDAKDEYGGNMWIPLTASPVFPRDYSFKLAVTYHAMTVTEYGMNYTMRQLFSPNATQKALYLANSNDTTSATNTLGNWTIMTGEYTTNGLARVLGTYAATGNHTCTVTGAFTVAGTGTPCATSQMYALYAGTYASDPYTLVAVEQQSASNIKNFNSGDTLTNTVSWSHA